MHSQQPPGVVQNWSTLQCSKQNTEQCGYDHAPVTRGRMRAQFPLPHGPPSQAPPLSKCHSPVRPSFLFLHRQFYGARWVFSLFCAVLCQFECPIVYLFALDRFPLPVLQS